MRAQGRERQQKKVGDGLVSAAASFWRDRSGNISIVGALSLPVLIGVVALVAEFGHGLLTRADNQRVADLAAYAAAVSYTSSASTSTMTSVANRVAALNGIPSTAVTATLVTSPKTASNQAVHVQIQTSNTLLLAPVLGAAATLPVRVNAYAEVGGSTPACIIALNSAQTGVTMSGGTAISAPACAIASNNTVTVPCGTTMTTIAVNYNSAAAPTQPCGGITAPAGKTLKITKTATTDPLSGNAAVTAATARISTVTAMTAPTMPSVPTGTAINFASGAGTTAAQATAIGCTATRSGSTWTVTCPAGGTYNISTLTVGGGVTLNFNVSGSATNTYNFSGLVTLAGTITFGPGTYKMAAGMTLGGGTNATFGAGTYTIGQTAANCSFASARVSICHAGTSLTFGGPSTFVLTAGISGAGGTTLNMGTGTTNSYTIGPNAGGKAIVLGGGAKLTMADATGGGSLFKVVGHIDVSSGGGSCLTLPAATNHDIKGYFVSAGGSILGAGSYTIDGYFHLGANGGGAVTCNATSVGMSAANTTFAISGSGTPTSGNCANYAWCITGGFTNVTLTAPTSGTYAKLLVVGPTGNTNGASFSGGASNVSLSGAFYFPNGPIRLAGGASLGNGTGQCLELIGSRIDMTGGTAVGSSCIAGSAGSGGTTVKLVQ